MTENETPTLEVVLREEALRRSEALKALDLAPSFEGAAAFLKRFCASEDRPWTFLDLHARLLRHRADAGAVFWRWLASEWSGFDAIPHRPFQTEFRRYRNAWSHECMSSADAAAYGELPKQFLAFRGQDAGAPLGLSWTLNRGVAEGFARGHRGQRNPKPEVIERTLRKANVALAVTDRNEAEVVLFVPPRRLAS